MSKGKNVVSKYIERRILDPNLIEDDPSKDLDLILVVPSFKESLEDLHMLCASLHEQEGQHIFELIIVVNNPASDSLAFTINKRLWESKEEFGSYNFPIYFIDKMNLPDSKKVGVGNARKIGLDQALIRFQNLSKNGILLCLDADCIVAPNYITEVFSSFYNNPKVQAASIGFMHRLEELENEEAINAIVEYEVHLRYYIEIQKWVNLPFAYQTVGSAMAVRAEAYAGEGGMPVLQAGEDFYFLHKFISKGTCINLPKALVFPSGRVSDRVPFGTGRAVGLILSSSDKYKSYNPTSFVRLKSDLEAILNNYPNFEMISDLLSKESNAFFSTVQLDKKLEECLSNTTNYNTFKKRFYQWFDAFLLMKYLHFLRDNYFEDLSLLEAVNAFEIIKDSGRIFNSSLEALEYYQQLDYPNEAQI